VHRPFLKMNGAGNDFVVFETADGPFRPEPSEVRRIADRMSGIGCDTVIVLEPSDRADLFMRIYNADGSEAESCGNATRCVARLAMHAVGRDRATIETRGGLLTTWAEGSLVAVDMGAPKLDWRDIPLAEPMDTACLNLDLEVRLHNPGAVNMGNPHVVFFVDELDDNLVQTWGPRVENHPLFPHKTNVGFAKVLTPNLMRLKVWERGVGQTRACGSGACAAVVAGARRNLVRRDVRVQKDGGDLLMHWRVTDDHVIMTGPAELEFLGRWPR
jgi:diaminopimelate epimerase